jgi:hypothetical protein
MFVMNVYDNVNSNCIKQGEKASHMYAVRTYFSLIKLIVHNYIGYLLQTNFLIPEVVF